MNIIINAIPLYNFLKYCELSKLEKKIIDFGAGGSIPPLSLFYSFGYKVFGVDNSLEQIADAERFANKRNMNLNIKNIDMCITPYEEEEFSFGYSYNTSVHIPKNKFSKAIKEFTRVLKPEGLLFLNFLSYKCDTYGKGKKLGFGEYASLDDDTIFVHYTKEEADNLLKEYDVVYFEERVINRKIKDEIMQSGFYDYIVKKKKL